MRARVELSEGRAASKRAASCSIRDASTTHSAAPRAVCSTAIVEPNDEGRSRSASCLVCCAPSTKACRSAARCNGGPLRQPEPIRWRQKGSGSHCGTTKTNERAAARRSAAASSASARCTAASSTSGTNGGFTSNEPCVGVKSKNEPSVPKGASTSAKALQKRSAHALSGEAKHSRRTPNRSRISSKTAGGTAHCEPCDPKASYRTSMQKTSRRKCADEAAAARASVPLPQVPLLPTLAPIAPIAPRAGAEGDSVAARRRE